MVELDPALRVGSSSGTRSSSLSSCASSSSKTRSADAMPGLHDVDHRRELGERLGELARVLDERLDVADASAGPTRPAGRRSSAMAT